MSNDKRKRKRSRLGNCDVCQSAVAKYNCPRCETVTCSVTCVKKHKTELDCDGVRVRSKFVPSDKIDELCILSDYRLMEDAKRCLEKLEWQRVSLDKAQKSVFQKLITNEDRIPAPGPSVVGNDKGQGRVQPETGIKAVDEEKSDVKSRSDDNKSDDDEFKLDEDNDENEKEETKSYSEEFEKRNVYKREDAVAEAPISIHHVNPKLLGYNENEKIEEEEIPVPTPVSHPKKVTEKSKRSQRRRKKAAANLELVMQRGGNRKEKLLENLQKVALSRGVLLKLLPGKFETHAENTSFFLNSENCIYWHLRVFFINANFFKLSLNKCGETKTLASLIQECLNRSRNHSRKKKIQDPLLVYRKFGVPKLTVLMPVERARNSEKKCYVLDKDKTLRQNLEGKCVVEFPKICVALPNCFLARKAQDNETTNFFDFMGSDEETDKEEVVKKDEIDLLMEKRKKKKEERRNERKAKKKSEGHNHNKQESDRESGELTESSDDSLYDTDSDSNESEEELFEESEFRSIYKDLLSTFESDVKKL